MILAHSAAFLVSGTLGVRFGLEAAGAFGDFRVRRVMAVYTLVFGLSAQQMAWIFRPHFTATSVFMRPVTSGGSALSSVYETIRRLGR